MAKTGGSLNEKTTRKQLALLLWPSWTSGLLCTVASLAVVIGIVGMTQYKGSQLEQEFLVWHTAATDHSYAASVNAVYADSAFQKTTGTLSLFVFWAFVGLFAYYLMYNVYDLFRRLSLFKDELGYVHVRRRQLIGSVVLRIGARFFALGLWFWYVSLFVRNVLPSVFAAVHVAAAQPRSLEEMSLACTAFIVLFVALHLHVILFRLTLQRPRAF